MNVKVGELTQARFLRELKNRFICEVELAGQIIECYVPSSCRLANFIELEGKSVLIRPTISRKVRTQYALVAVPYKKSYLILNSSLANQVIEGDIRGRRFSFLGKRTQILKEHRIENYKADLFIVDSKTVIEIKSIISTNNVAIFPSVYSERAIEQLKSLKALLQSGYTACYVIVSLNPYVREIAIDRNTSLFQLFSECMALGMKVKGFTCRLREGCIALNKELLVNVNNPLVDTL